MTDKPTTASAGKTLAILGGIICIIGTALTFDAGSSNIMAEIGIPLLSAVLFFAISGELNVNGSMKRGAMAFLCFLNIAVLAFGTIYGTMELYLGAVLILLAVGVLALSTSSGTYRWIQADRI
ncbi:MAG: hypothetical protein PHX75_04330 [Candidatus Methanomethylophilaceae archaeon]|jgi:hypothetical protein|nr:hypothetical protein [Candidatus Methanomethylophilaceae archaeon]